MVTGAVVAALTGLMVVVLGAAAATLGRTGGASAAAVATDLFAVAFCRMTFWGATPVFGIATDVGAGV